MRIEWRAPGRDDDVLIAVDDADTVLEAWQADANLLRDFLNAMPGLEIHRGKNTLDTHQGPPESFGRMVIARSPDGGIVAIDPELYWDRVTHWFREQGDDHHAWRKSR